MYQWPHNVTNASLLVVDVDNDGGVDVVLAGRTGSIDLFTAGPNNTHVHRIGVEGVGGSTLALSAACDVNNDGFIDIVGIYTDMTTTVSTLRVMLNTGDGMFAPSFNILAQSKDT